jgi:hypothetical protein
MSDYVTMKELGKLFGTTSHVVGRTLKEVGLRTKEGKPTRAAFAGRFCDQHPKVFPFCCLSTEASPLLTLLHNSERQ